MEFFQWDIDPEAFSLGPVTIRWYGLCFLSAFLGGFFTGQYIYRKEGQTEKALDSLLVHMVLGTVIGARLGHCIFYDPGYYFSDPILIFKIWEGGLASHGALIGILVSLWIYAKRQKFNYLWVLDKVAIPVALAGFFIRLGNFFNSEIIGVPTQVSWAIIFKKVDNLPRHPAQLYESISYLIIFLFMFFIYRKKGNEVKPGLYIGLFFVCIFAVRFFIEFVKIRQAAFGEDLPLSMGQWLSIPVVLMGGWLLFRKTETA